MPKIYADKVLQAFVLCASKPDNKGLYGKSDLSCDGQQGTL